MPTTLIVASYEGDLTRQPFHQLPDEVGFVNAVAVLDPTGDGDQVVVAGVERAWKGNNLFAYDVSGKELWGLDISDQREWPDCTAIRPWACGLLAAGDTDGEPGDEIVAVTSDLYEYPTRVSVINPRTQKIVSTFWHMGGIGGVLVLSDFLGPGAPAIVAWGLNNKLDGFNDAIPSREKRYTMWDMVPVVMVLDPKDMDGLGPPQTDRISGLAPISPFAYAFLDLPYSRGVLKVSYDPKTHARREQQLPHDYPWDGLGNIGEVKASVLPAAPDAETRLEITVVVRDLYRNVVSRGALFVTANLTLRDVLPNNTAGETKGVDVEYWMQYWRPIIQNGTRVGD
jgi:hypothetical protein